MKDKIAIRKDRSSNFACFGKIINESFERFPVNLERGDKKRVSGISSNLIYIYYFSKTHG